MQGWAGGWRKARVGQVVPQWNALFELRSILEEWCPRALSPVSSAEEMTPSFKVTQSLGSGPTSADQPLFRTTGLGRSSFHSMSPAAAPAAYLGQPAGSYFLGGRQWPCAFKGCFFQDSKTCYLRSRVSL